MCYEQSRTLLRVTQFAASMVKSSTYYNPRDGVPNRTRLLAVQPSVVEPADPFKGGLFGRLDAAPPSQGSELHETR